MRKLLLLFVAGLAGLVSAFALTGSVGRSAVAGSPLHATPRHAFVGPAGAPVTLIGLNIVPVWPALPGHTWKQARYDQIAAAGFTAVRFVVHWPDFESVKGQWNETNLATLDTAVARAKAAGLYVIL